MVQRRQQQWWSSGWLRQGNKPLSRTTSATNSDLMMEDAAVTAVAPRADREIARGSLQALNQEQETNHAVLQNGEQTEEQNQGANGETSSTLSSIQQRLSRFRHWAILCMFILSLILVVAVIVPVTMVVQKRNNSPSSPSAQVQTLDYAYLQEIRTILGPSPEQWANPTAPQLRATEVMAMQQPKIPTNSSRLYQRYALLTLYFANGGQRWDPLDPMEHECDWFVVECTPQQEVVELNMGNLLGGMTGTLVSELGLLSRLTIVDFQGNRLVGTIPATFYQLTNLVILRLSSNRFSSTIGSSIGNLTKLSSLHLSNNFFEGALPASVGILSGLRTIAVNGNLFSGNTLLEYMPMWTNLEYFDVSDTDISGTIPAEIGLLTNLMEIEVMRSRLTGTIPSELGLLDKLESFAIHDSGLSGTLPTTLGNLKSAQYLSLSQVFLTGTIPTEIGQLSTTLLFLSLSFNMLNGTIPTELARLTSLQELYLNYNQFTGTIPSQLGDLSNLRRFKLSRSRLEGSMPVEICALFENGALARLENSCDMVTCDCCTQCIFGAREK